MAAFRAERQPHVLMVFEVGTATMMAAEDAVKPLHDVMAESLREGDRLGLRLQPGAMHLFDPQSGRRLAGL